MTKDRRRKTDIRAHQAATAVPYMVARRDLTPPTLAEVMAEHPLLHCRGIGAFHHARHTAEQYRDFVDVERRKLAVREGQVLAVASFLLKHVTPIKTPAVNSYAMKHVVESAIGAYVPNGVLIASALIARYSHKLIPNNPNMLLGMSARDVSRLSSARRGSMPLTTEIDQLKREVDASTWSQMVTMMDRGAASGTISRVTMQAQEEGSDGFWLTCEACGWPGHGHGYGCAPRDAAVFQAALHNLSHDDPATAERIASQRRAMTRIAAA